MTMTMLGRREGKDVIEAIRSEAIGDKDVRLVSDERIDGREAEVAACQHQGGHFIEAKLNIVSETRRK